MHMPRWASRLLLEITDVRIERLLDISEEDARAEGAPRGVWEFDRDGECSHRIGFAHLWDSINDKVGYNWNANPWVWVICFKRVTS